VFFHIQSMGTWREIVRREISRHGDQGVIWETKWRTGEQPFWTPVVMLGCTMAADSPLDTVTLSVDVGER
jgi:hypothetical protein